MREVIYAATVMEDGTLVTLAELAVVYELGQWIAKLDMDGKPYGHKEADSRELALAEVEGFRQMADRIFARHPNPALNALRFRRIT